MMVWILAIIFDCRSLEENAQGTSRSFSSTFVTILEKENPGEADARFLRIVISNSSKKYLLAGDPNSAALLLVNKVVLFTSLCGVLNKFRVPRTPFFIAACFAE